MRTPSTSRRFHVLPGRRSVPRGMRPHAKRPVTQWTVLVRQRPRRLHSTFGLLRRWRCMHVAARMRLGNGAMTRREWRIVGAVGAFVAAGVASCGGPNQEPPTQEAGVDALADGTTLDAAPDRSPPQYPIVDSSGDCGPMSDEYTLGSCCSGLPCLGFCVAIEDGGVGCSCFGIAGGCEAYRSLICCRQGHGCDTPLSCYPTK